MNTTIPSLASGHGLPSRRLSLCDGRTTLRLSNEPAGFDLLMHYAPDSHCHLSRVLHDEQRPLHWLVDGERHRFDWVEVFPFGYVNREERSGELPAIVSECVVEQGLIQWRFTGVQREAVLVLPRVMIVAYNNRDASGTPLEVIEWKFTTEKSAWHAARHEQWLLRDMTGSQVRLERTYTPEPHTSTLHLSITAKPSLQVETTADEIRFILTPAGNEPVALALAIGSPEAVVVDPAAAMLRQRRRYQAVAAATPQLDFGRHTALRKFSQLQPLYLESMRVPDTPGAVRGNNEYYWVWGWDMTRPLFGTLAANRAVAVRETMDFHVRTGFITQHDNTLTRDLRPVESEPMPVDFLVVHDYLAWTGDVDATRRWAPALTAAFKKLVAKVGSTGMRVEHGWSTDFPEEFGRTFAGWLCYPTAWDYAAYLGMEKVFHAWGDDAMAGQARELAGRIRRNFVRLFWNERTGFWNEGVHPTDPDWVCDTPLSTALAGMDSPYGEDLYATRLASSAAYAAHHYLRHDGVHLIARGEVRGWKEWTRSTNNWFAANDTMLARLFRTVGDAASLEKLFYLYELNFGYQPNVFEGKPFRRPLLTAGGWQAFGASAWYRNLIEAAAGLWTDLGGLTLVPCGLSEPVRLTGLHYRGATLDFEAHGQGVWPRKLLLDGQPLVGTTKLPPLSPGRHTLEVEYGPSVPVAPLLTLAVDAEIITSRVIGANTTVHLRGHGYTPVSFFSPSQPALSLNGAPLACEWDDRTSRGRTRFVLDGEAELIIATTDAN